MSSEDRVNGPIKARSVFFLTVLDVFPPPPATCDPCLAVDGALVHAIAARAWADEL